MRGEVILSAGVVETPKLLLLSGVGDSGEVAGSAGNRDERLKDIKEIPSDTGRRGDHSSDSGKKVDRLSDTVSSLNHAYQLIVKSEIVNVH